MGLTIMATPETQADAALEIMQSKALSLIAKAEAVASRLDEKGWSPEDYLVAMTILGLSKDGIKQAEELFKPIKRKYDEAKKVVLDQERSLIAKFEPAKRLIEAKIFEYRREQEKRQREEQARLAELARKEAEEAALQEALMAESMGYDDAVDQILEAPVYVPPPAPRSIAPKVDGLGFQKNWKARVVNFEAVPDMYKEVNQVALNNLARSLKEKAKVPGVEFNFEESSRRVG